MRLRVGLTGGIGSGKSEVGNMFADLGAFRVEADLIARQAVAPGTPALERIFVRWPQVCRADGTLDRAALGEIVFADPAQREELNAIVHPVVRELTQQALSRARKDQLAIEEVPLLFETGLYRNMDVVIVVTAPQELRIERVMARNGWTREQVLKRMASQVDPEEAVRLATYVLRNEGDLTALREKVEHLFRALSAECRRSGAPPSR